jgi:hypothetical protein
VFWLNMSSHFLGGVTEDRRTACIHKIGEIPIVMRDIIYEKSNHTSYQRSRSVTGPASIFAFHNSTPLQPVRRKCLVRPTDMSAYSI